MRSPCITNSLLRLEGVATSVSPPFERPRADLDFAVLELGEHSDVPAWCTRVTEALHAHGALVRELQSAGARAVFVQSASVMPVTFEVEFLRVLADAEIALEYFHENA